ncbi:vanadium-dependent haloperoxidase [Congregibacter sp.]|uniref:vanadium-dependent haloperoxidase n=1 Tax=Congregibacter sp. TaxID=2744308 RepID=UPI003F6B9B99
MTKTNDPDSSTVNLSDSEGEANSRRGFLKIGAGVLTTGAAGVLTPLSAVADDFSRSDADSSVRKQRGPNRRSIEAHSIRESAADQHLSYTSGLGTQLDNDDEQRYADEHYYASFTKTLPSNEYGEVVPEAFEALQTAMRTGERADFDAIELDQDAARTLANPQGAFRYEVAGLDSHATRMPPSHSFRSAELAGEMGEVYWQALTRDVPFSQYDNHSLLWDAVYDLNVFSVTPGVGGSVDSSTIFRGETPGDLVGPYISQFLWQPFSFGPIDVVQQYEAGLAGVDFMTDGSNWLNVQRGGAPGELLSFGPKRYINDNRALSEYVHRDVLYQAYLNAALIILGYGGNAIDSGNPYFNGSTDNQGAFTSLGGPFVIDLVSTAGNLALSGAWFQKWRVHRLLRPEAYAGRVHFEIESTRDYELHRDILNSAALSKLYDQQGTYFLPLAYTEGSPTHPSYPAGHATVAGSCVTVLKAFFKEDFVIPNAVVSDDYGSQLLDYYASDLTVGGELNKLANNIAIGRDAAGVHYRQDGVQGLAVGEQQAIALLQDKSRTLHEAGFDGFTLTKFDGRRINIKDGQVTLV